MSTTPDAGAPRRIPELDGLRGLAISLVLVWHYLVNVPHTWLGAWTADTTFYLGLTWSGVDLFFVLSGFLIGGILLDNRRAQNYFKVFYTRRICRIFPLYYVWLGLAFALLYLTPAGLRHAHALAYLFEPTLPPWLYLTYTQNIFIGVMRRWGNHWIDVTWSLAVEEQFYLLLPLLVRYLAPRKLPYALVALILAAPVLRLLLFYFYWPAATPTYVLMPCRADALLVGVLCAYAVRNPHLSAWLKANVRRLYELFCLLLAGLLFLIFRYANIGSFDMSSYGYTLLAALYACMLLICLNERRGPLTGLTRNAVLRRLGTLAYGVYLLHQLINVLCHALLRGQQPQLRNATDLLITLLALGVTLTTAYVSWTYFEKRLVALGHRVKYRPAVGSSEPEQMRPLDLNICAEPLYAQAE